MKRLFISGPLLAVAFGFLCLVATGAPDTSKATDKAQPTTDKGQDFVFLGESRPVLMRLHVQVDGRSLEAAWEECIDYVFKYLDVNNDGVLSKDELERGPAAEQFTGGNIAAAFMGRGRGGASATLKMEAVDADGDGKVTRAELAAYYRKHGFTPFQFNFTGGGDNPIGKLAILFGGGRSEPSVEEVNKAIFELLDTNKDGKLTLKQLAAAESVLLQLDEDEDEIVTTRELVPNNGLGNSYTALLAMGGMGNQQKQTSSPLLVPVLTPGEVPTDLVKRMAERYGTKEKDVVVRLSQKELGLDDATFKALDANGDGVLDAKELGGFVARTPDIECILRLGKKKDSEARLEIVTGKGRSPLANKLAVHELYGLLDLGLTRAELRSYDQEGPDRVALMRQDYMVQFRQADTTGKGVVGAAQAQGNQRLNRLFKAMDRGGDGWLTEKKIDAYFDHLQELQKRVAAGSVTLSISDQSRGLFDLLDTDRDGRLSVREMRRAPKLLKQFDRNNKGYLTRDDLPHTYRMEVRRASINLNDGGGLAAVAELYSVGGDAYDVEAPQKGPLWFRKMDKNRDGDVSRKEWLYSDELFRKIDTDGDGLISVEEAIKADELFRKAAEKK